jgi:hypothetical protein
MDGFGIDISEYDEVLRDCEGILEQATPEMARRMFMASCLLPMLWLTYSHKGIVSYNNFCTACAEVVEQFTALRLRREEEEASHEAEAYAIIATAAAASRRSCRLLHHIQFAAP